MVSPTAALTAPGHLTALGMVVMVVGAAVAAFLGAGVAAYAGPVDQPRSRGAHSSPTPTSGGLGVILGTSVGIFAIPFMGVGSPREWTAIAAALAMSGGLGVLGAVDDLFDLGARLKLLVQLAVALTFAAFVARVEFIPLGGGAGLFLGFGPGVVGTALWLVVVCNAVNFMDGANGLAAGSVALALLALGACALIRGDPLLGLSALACCAGQIGFLPWNLPRARVFQGDAGALFSSMFLASLAVIGAGDRGSGAAPVYLAPLALVPFLTDVLLTLLERARAGTRLLEAHADHLYQRWLSQTGASHLALALRVYVIMAIFGFAALILAVETSLAVQALGLTLGVAVAVIGWRRLRRRYFRLGQNREAPASSPHAPEGAAD